MAKKKLPSPAGWLMHRGKRKTRMTRGEYMDWCDTLVVERGTDAAREVMRGHKWVAYWV